MIEIKNGEFLKIYRNLGNSNENTTSIIVRNKKAYFIQVNYDCILFSELDVDTEDEYTISLNTQRFCALLEKLNYNCTITKDSIFSKTGKFVLTNVIEDRDLETIIDIALQIPEKTILIHDFDKFNIARNFVGKEFGYVCLRNNSLIATDRSIAYRDFLDVEGNDVIDKSLFLHPNVIRSIPDNSKEKSSSVEVCLYNEDMNHWSLNLKDVNTKIFLNFRELVFPDFSSKEMREVYEHEDYFLFDKNEFFNKLDIMMVFAVYNQNNRIIMTFQENKMLIQYKGADAITSDSIDCKFPESLEGQSIAVNGRYLERFKSLFKNTIKVGYHIEKPILRFSEYLENEEDERLIMCGRIKL